MGTVQGSLTWETESNPRRSRAVETDPLVGAWQSPHGEDRRDYVADIPAGFSAEEWRDLLLREGVVGGHTLGKLVHSAGQNPRILLRELSLWDKFETNWFANRASLHLDDPREVEVVRSFFMPYVRTGVLGFAAGGWGGYKLASIESYRALRTLVTNQVAKSGIGSGPGGAFVRLSSFLFRATSTIYVAKSCCYAAVVTRMDADMREPGFVGPGNLPNSKIAADFRTLTLHRLASLPHFKPPTVDSNDTSTQV